MIPSLFISHGAPYLAVQQNEYSRFLRGLGDRFAPKAIVVFTAHWESNMLAMTDTDDIYETIYDYYGFPEEMYKIKYPAKGSRNTASMLEEKFRMRGISARREERRGLDHGSWVALRHMYPNADIPVVQLSVNPFLPVKEQYQIGQALQGLGTEDILVIGSGTTVHNLRWYFPDEATAAPEAIAFDDWLIEKIQVRDLDSLARYDELAPYAHLAVPRPEHFVPLFIAMGSGDEGKTPVVIHRSYEAGTFSNLCFEF